MTGASPDQQPPRDAEHDIELDVEGHAIQTRDAGRVAADKPGDIAAPEVEEVGRRVGGPQPKMRH